MSHGGGRRRYRLLGPDGFYTSAKPGTLGGHSRQGVYGRLDCPVALSLIRRGRAKVEYRVFFADESTARASGYRPCGACLREEYRAWKDGIGAP
jgi:metal binding Ada-like protein